MRSSKWNAAAFALSLVLMATGLVAIPIIRESNGVHFFPDGISGPIFSTGSDILNVRAPAFGATGDDSHDDAPAIQAALTAAKVAGGGRVYLPPGTYKLNSTLVIGDKTELFGAGRASVLKRADLASTNQFDDVTCSQLGGTINDKFFLMNDKYNCGNTGIVLHDFALDGSLITMACTSCTGGPTNASVGISFSALVDSHIYNLYLEAMPQDGIFLKNGGVRTDIHHVTINGHNMLWGNGAGINVEMHTGAGFPANNPGVLDVHDNYIISKGPDFCDLDLHLACAQDSDCAAVGGVCGLGAGASSVEAILGFWASDAGGTAPARMLIHDNRVESTDNHIAIEAFGGSGVEIRGNRIAPFVSGTAMSQVYNGISILASTATTTRASTDVVVTDNVILGGGVANDRRAIAVIDDTGAGSTRIKVNGNIVTNRNLRSTFLGAVEMRGVSDSEVIGNTVQGIAGNHGIVLGNTGITTADVKVLGNTIADITTASKDCVVLRNTTRTRISENVFRNCARGVEYQSATVSGTEFGRNTFTSVTTPVLRTVVSTQPLCDVTDFGAAGNATTDDTAAIQAAIDACGVGGEIKFPAGTYMVTAALKFRAFQQIYGAGRGGIPLASNIGSIIKTVTPSISVFQSNTSAQSSCTHSSNCDEYVHIHDLAVVLDTAATSSTAFDLTNVSQSFINNVFVRGTAAGQVGVLLSSSGTLQQGGVANTIRDSMFYNVERGVIVKNGANAALIEGNLFLGNSTALANISVKGACTGGSCGVADSCEVDADCTCGATDCRPNASGSVSDTRILANDIEGPATAGTNIINVGKVTVIGDNYMETQTSGGQINIDEDGGDTLIRGNRIQLSTTGGNDIGVSLRADTGASRCIVQGNTFAGTGAALPIKEVAATTNTEVLENHYDFSFTTPVTLVGTAILLRDVVGLIFTQATLPNVAAGSTVGCSDCTAANPCAGGGTSRAARQLGGNVWACN